MAKYIAQRVVYMLITLFLIVSITFLLLQFMPGSPFKDEKLTDEQKEILNEKYGLSDPLPVKYLRYMGNVVRLDFGVSFKYSNKPVADMISERVVNSARIGIQALIFGTFVGIMLGIIAALNRNSFWDHVTTVIAVMGVSIPGFVLGALIQQYFGVTLKILPVVYDKTPGRMFLSTIMPTFALSVFVISSIARFMRTELIEVLGTDYVLLAQAKGLSKPVVIWKHAIRNALIPVITIMGPMTVSLLVGGTVIERIFGVPGLGNMMVSAIQTNDYFVILAEATFFSTLFVTAILVVDILYGVVDPRIRVAGGGE